MKKVILMTFLFVACGTTNNKTSSTIINTTEQIFISDQTKGLPGKCYSKMKRETEFLWAEVLCGPQITKGIIKQIQIDLMRLEYKISNTEISKKQFGSTTKQAIKDFQLKNKMAYGGLDWATINRLKTIEITIRRLYIDKGK